jgi:anthranilate synthase component 1
VTLSPVFESPPLHEVIDHAPSPLRLYELLYADEPYTFLYESLETDGSRGRYSFLGGRPKLVLTTKGDLVEIQTVNGTERLRANPYEVLRTLMGPRRPMPAAGPFVGGAVGYLGYDMVRTCERLPDESPDDLGLPDSCLVFPREVIAVDHRTGQAHVLVHDDGQVQRRRDELLAAISCAAAEEPQFKTVKLSVQPLNARVRELNAPATTPNARATSFNARTTTPNARATAFMPWVRPERGSFPWALTGASHAEIPPVSCNKSRTEFHHTVRAAQEYIRAGDIFQVVLSRRFEFPWKDDCMGLYRALRRLNPSPYMYFLRLDRMHILGSSPEMLVKLRGRTVITRPLAGTRPRGECPEQDRALENELRADEKERAEHVMLVDLARNDIGRVCRLGSVRTSGVMQVERYSNVMHLVSEVRGSLAPGCDAVDVVQATLPAGTVSGAPKIRAMEIIEQLEPVKRGPYGGAIGYFSRTGDMDMCIAIRTIVLAGNRGYLQVGAGIVADSDPDREFHETAAKAQALLTAVAESQ